MLELGILADDLKAELILPQHLQKVREGDIVLLGSEWSGDDSPWL